MAGSIGLSLSQRFDTVTHVPLDGGKLYFYAAGTTTPQNAYQDSALTIPWPNPLTLDSGGNVPQLFFADGSIKFRLANAAGVTQLAVDDVLVIGPSSGGGGGGGVDATTVLTTGDVKYRYGTGTLSGFVRPNAKTIGSATSGATERANADCQNLFEYLWSDTSLTVSTGRGVSANVDWVANKTITLPDWRGRVLAAPDDMGNASAGRLAAVMASTVLGTVAGSAQHTLLAPELPAVQVGVSVSGGVNSLSGQNDYVRSSKNVIPVQAGAGAVGLDPTATNQVTGVTSTGSFTVTGATNNLGSSTPFNTTQPTALVTIYMKL